MASEVIRLFPGRESPTAARVTQSQVALRPSLYVEVNRIPDPSAWFWEGKTKLQLSVRTYGSLFEIGWTVEVEDNLLALEQHLRLLEAGCRELGYSYEPIRNDLKK